VFLGFGSALVRLRAVPRLPADLKSKDWWVRKLAADALGHLGDAQAIAPLRAALADNDPDVCRASAAAQTQIVHRRVGGIE
jgi:HEAT repeat protein